jgi:hypothetical protein
MTTPTFKISAFTPICRYVIVKSFSMVEETLLDSLLTPTMVVVPRKLENAFHVYMTISFSIYRHHVL